MNQEGTRLRTIRESARLLNVSVSGLYRKVQSGELPAYRFGRKVLVDLDEVMASMRAQTGVTKKDTKR